MRVFFQFEYDALPRNVRRQLALSVANPEQLVYGQGKASKLWLALNLALLFVASLFLIILASYHFADPADDLLWASKGKLVWYILLSLAASYGAYSLWHYRDLKRRLHFLPGVYLFPLSLIDARKDKIAVYDLVQMRKLEATHHSKNTRYTKTVFNFIFNDGSRTSLTIRDKSLADAALEKFHRFKNTARLAYHSRDLAGLYGFDPFLDLRKGRWRGALNHIKMTWSQQLLDRLIEYKLPLILLVFALASLLWYGRNAAADKRMYLNAKQEKTESSYLAYIARGKFHVTEMRQELPRIVLNEIQSRNSVTMLRTLKARFPASEITEDINQEIHLLYHQAFLNFKAQAVNADARLIKSIEYLLKHAEENDDPQVAIHLSRPSDHDLNQLDASLRLRENRQRGMRIVPAAKYFADDNAKAREAKLIKGISAGFNAIFPSDVLSFSPADASQPSNAMLQIDYQLEPSGKFYPSSPLNKQDAFAGLIVRFKAAIVIPDIKERWKFDLDVAPPDAMPGTVESQVYTVMAESAFDKLASKINAAFFRPGSAAFTKQAKSGN